MGTAAGLDSRQFFELVEQHLVGPMAALGFAAIHGSVNDQPSSRSALTSGGGLPGERPFLWFDYGFEAGGQAVKQLLGPIDPESEDEWWLSYEPATGVLELGEWEPVARGRVDWEIRTDSGPCDPAEVERRLVALGRAVGVFVRERGGFPL